jgi:hypothetical protein
MQDNHQQFEQFRADINKTNFLFIGLELLDNGKFQKFVGQNNSEAHSSKLII